MHSSLSLLSPSLTIDMQDTLRQVALNVLTDVQCEEKLRQLNILAEDDEIPYMICDDGNPTRGTCSVRNSAPCQR